MGDYAFQKGALKGFQFGSGVRYVGFTYSDSSNTLLVPGYTLVDAMIAYDLGGISPKLEGLSAALGTTVLATQRKKF